MMMNYDSTQVNEKMLAAYERNLREQKKVLQKLEKLGLRQPEQLILPSSGKELAEIHSVLATVLGNSHMPLELDENPLYFGWQENGQYGFVTRTVEPNRKRRTEKTTEGSVEQAINEWLNKTQNTSIAETTFFMRAGVASNGSRGKYTFMQSVNFLMCLDKALVQKKPLLMASTARKENDQAGQVSSAELLRLFTDKYIAPLGNQGTIAQMERHIPTELWGVFIPQRNLEQLRSNLINLSNSK